MEAFEAENAQIQGAGVEENFRRMPTEILQRQQTSFDNGTGVQNQIAHLDRLSPEQVYNVHKRLKQSH